MTKSRVVSESREVSEHFGLDVVKDSCSIGSLDGQEQSLRAQAGGPEPICSLSPTPVETSKEYRFNVVNISDKPIFWDGGYELKSKVKFKFSDLAPLKLTLRDVLSKYLPLKLMPPEDTAREVTFIVNSNFVPLKYSDTLSMVFTKGQDTCTVYFRQVDDDSERDGHVSEACAGIEDSGEVRLKIVEVSERKILWDSDTASFQSDIALKLNRDDISKLRVEQVLATVLGSNYYEPGGSYVEKKFWTENVGVVSCKDRLDMLFSKKSEMTLYLRLITTVEEMEWQEIIEAINAFASKVCGADEELLRFYSEQVFREMETLKAKIRCDQKNDLEIQSLMTKLIEALTFMNEIRVTKSSVGWKVSREISEPGNLETREEVTKAVEKQISEHKMAEGSRTNLVVVAKSSCKSIMSAICGKFRSNNFNDSNCKDAGPDVVGKKATRVVVTPKFYSW